jgi:hypothetical protein
MGCGRKEWEIAINMRGNIFKIRSMAMESLAGQEGMFIKETINKIFDLGLERCIGWMVHAIKVNG